MTHSGRIFALSDHHFGHQNIIKYCNRQLTEQEAKQIGLQGPISSQNLTALDDAKSMIVQHNAIVKPEDLMIFGGDVSASAQGRRWVKSIIPKLNGRKVLIRGNHDHLSAKEYIKMGFESVHDVLVIDEFCFCHFPEIPAVTAMCESKNLTLCCGHTHKPFNFTGLQNNIRRINLAVDVVGRTPILIKS